MPDLLRSEPPLNVVLVEPRIPPNTGNIARLCSVTGSRLHLVGPLGFSVADKDMRRAGLDYWFGLWKRLYVDLAEFEAALPAAGRVHLFTARASRGLWGVELRAGDYLLFGSEPDGLPPALLAARPEAQVAIPQLPGARSLNLSSAAAVAVYEALRQVSAGSRDQRAIPEHLR